MTTHLGVMCLFAALVSIVFGTLVREEAGEQVRLAVRMFLAFVAGAGVLGWLMFFVFG
jgi:hypothetical protein